MKLFTKALAVAAALTLTGCGGFSDIKSDTDIITANTSASTTTQQTLSVPELTAPTVSETPPSSNSGEDIVPPEIEDEYPVSMIATANVNARKGPSIADEIDHMVIEGTEVKVTGLADGWYQVEIDGKQLYIIGDYLKEKDAEE